MLTLLGPVLGVKALTDIRRRPGLRGRGPAITAIIPGLVVTAGWVAGGVS